MGLTAVELLLSVFLLLLHSKEVISKLVSHMQVGTQATS